MTPDKLAEIEGLMEKARLTASDPHSGDYGRYVDAIINSAPDLIAAARFGMEAERKLTTATESWQKECDLLESQRDAAESERIEWVQRGERAETENERLKARLAEAEGLLGEVLHAVNGDIIRPVEYWGEEAAAWLKGEGT